MERSNGQQPDREESPLLNPSAIWEACEGKPQRLAISDSHVVEIRPQEDHALIIDRTGEVIRISQLTEVEDRQGIPYIGVRESLFAGRTEPLRRGFLIPTTFLTRAFDQTRTAANGNAAIFWGEVEYLKQIQKAIGAVVRG